ncbi:hypothetical protein [Enterococcus sp.]|uniref:hypothetical protein n=1 Tax=Enterococcus sp. TaxID=35783 RepID=UPI002FC9FB4B
MNIKEMLELFDSKDVVAEWDRRDELKIRFNGLKDTTLATYQKEMESMDEFKEGILKPSHGVTFININIFVQYLRWKDANLYRTKKIPLDEVLKGVKSC